MTSAVPVEASPITSVEIKTRLADGWIRYKELVGYIMLEPVFFPCRPRLLTSQNWALSDVLMSVETQVQTDYCILELYVAYVKIFLNTI